eukprot:m.220509 g.220509  ORF g.220509 m.220509 type:complete len:556 (+) comp13832_c1_seq6:383-2050(+)
MSFYRTSGASKNRKPTHEYMETDDNATPHASSASLNTLDNALSKRNRKGRRKGVKNLLDDSDDDDNDSLATIITSLPDTDSMSSQFHLAKNVQLSLCGFKVSPASNKLEVNEEDFNAQLVTFETLRNAPNVLENKALVVKIQGKYFSWKVAAPQVMSYLLFNKPLPQEIIDTLVAQHQSQRQRSRWFFWGQTNSPPSKNKNDPATDTQYNGQPNVERSSLSPLDVEDVTKIDESESDSALTKNENVEIAVDDPIAQPTRHSKGMSHKVSGNDADVEDDETSADESPKISSIIRPRSSSIHGLRSRSLSSEQLKSLNLNQGLNRVEYTVHSKYQGVSNLYCNVFLWKHDSKIVISDVDGTITKSDVLGHAAPIFGRDWTQNGVASLFREIEANGYHLVYLSSRSISQSTTTKEYLESVQQEGQQLPSGPILLSPSSLFKSFHREVIKKRPQEFKIACLTGVKNLFPTNPFVAGFGNRETDVVTYKEVGIIESKIFIINPTGLLCVSSTATKSSYSKLTEIVDQVFPSRNASTTEEEDPTFNSFSYWNEPLEAYDSD